MLSALSLARRVRVRALAPAPVQAATLFFPPSAAASPFAGALPFLLGGMRCATSKAGGSSRNGRDSRPKFLGVKRFGGECVEPGDIILRQRGARVGIVESTASVGMGRDHTIFALKPGFVKFWRHRLRRKSFVEVVRSPPQVLPSGAGGAEATAAAAAPPLKYPIVRLRRGDLPHLLKLVDRAGSAAGGASVDMSAEVRRQLDAFRAAQQQAGSGGGGAAAGGGGPAAHNSYEGLAINF